MQAIINYTHSYEAPVMKANPAAAIIRKEAAKKIILFVAILACFITAVNI